MIWALVCLLVVSALIHAATIALVLVLLGGKDDRFVTWRQMSKIVDRMARIERANKVLYRYVEAVDEATGANGHKVLTARVPEHGTAA